jgi:hypothetical protein
MSLMMLTKQPKPRKCPVCLDMYTPKRYGLRLTRCCENAGCRLDYAQGVRAKEAEKEFNKQTREMRKAANESSLAWWAKKVQKVCNEYILIRDKDEPCISCGTRKPHLKYDAGHFVPVGRSKALRYEETNIHRQCNNNCNVHKSGNYIEYRKAMVKKYGAEHVEWLEFDHPEPRRRIEDYKAIYEHYKAKIKQLKVQS